MEFKCVNYTLQKKANNVACMKVNILGIIRDLELIIVIFLQNAHSTNYVHDQHILPSPNKAVM